MIYTCYQMIEDCNAGKPEGWSFFIANYVPVVREFLKRHRRHLRDDRAFIERTIRGLVTGFEPMAERQFTAELRQRLLASAGEPGPTVTPNTQAKLEPLTVGEKQVVWFDSKRYDRQSTARILKMDTGSVAKIRDRAVELLGSADLFSTSANAPEWAPPGAKSEKCVSSKTLLDIIDGRSTWQERGQVENHLQSCWQCIDHLCRLREVGDVLRASKPLDPEESDSFRKALGLAPEKRSLWQRVFAR